MIAKARSVRKSEKLQCAFSLNIFLPGHVRAVVRAEMRSSIVGMLIMGVGAAAAAAAPPLTIQRGSAAYFFPSADPTQSRPIAHAWSDFRRDFYKVIGTALAPQPSLPSPSCVGGAWFTFAVDNTTLAPEAFTVVAVPDAQGGPCGVLAVTGGDVRGLLFGMYHVSGDIFGVDPNWWFQDAHPAYAGVVSVPSTYSYASGAPVFQIRVAFINDEDISGYFFPDPLGESVYGADAANRYAETLLRLRVNAVTPSTFGYVDERHYRTFQDRGLILNQHHVTVLGVNTYAWPLGVPYAFRLSPEPLLAAWTTLVNAQLDMGREVAWTIGYRGENDYPFWQDDVACVTLECRGTTISQAMANQTAIVRAATAAAAALAGDPPATATLLTILQMEMLPLLEAGVLTIPEGVSTIFTDFDSCFRISGLDNVTAGDGFYAHLAAMSGWPLGGSSGQLTEWATLSTAFRYMWEMVARNATRIGVINVSDMRHIPITMEGVFRYLWNPAAFNATAAGCPSTATANAAAASSSTPSNGHVTGPRGPVGFWPVPLDGSTCDLRVTPEAAMSAFLLEFATRHYGGAANASVPQAVADLHAAYFNLPYLTLSFPMGDHFFGTSLRGLLEPFQADVDGDRHDPSLAGAAGQLLGWAAGNLPPLRALFLDTVLPLAPSIPPGTPSAFYASHVVAQIAIHYQHALAFESLGQAATAWAHGAAGPGAVLENATSALAALDACLDYLREGEGEGVWRGMYQTETWTFIVGTRARIASLVAALSGNGATAAAPPADVYADYDMYSVYECPAHDPSRCMTFPLASFNASVAWDVVVRTVCATGADVELARRGKPAASAAAAAAALSLSGGCSTTPAGVTFYGGGASIALFTPVSPLRGLSFPTPVIRYTLDGSAVTPSSPAYTGAPIVITSNTTVRAQAFDGASGSPLAFETSALVSGS
jgi:hypothetical protein